MAISINNPYCGRGLPNVEAGWVPDQEAVAALLRHCPAHARTPLLESPALAAAAKVARLTFKDERGRMGLGSFKALGAGYAIAHDAAEALAGRGAAQESATPKQGAAADGITQGGAAHSSADWGTALAGRCYVTASAGNHGLSLAAAARLFGARAVIYLAHTVPQGFEARLAAKGAEVVRAGETYEQSMEAAAHAAETQGLTLLSDSSWPGYTELPFRVMEGYTQMASEIIAQMDSPPSHVFLQAGVGGLAAALAGALRRAWGALPRMIVVEPEAAPALIESIRAGALVETSGPVSSMGRLDCKTPSMLALAALARDADGFAVISEAEAARAVACLAQNGIATTPSGAAGFAAALAGVETLSPGSHVLCILSEGPEDG